MFQRERTQFGPLVRAFFARFFESDIAEGGDLKATFFWLLSFLAAPGFLLPILIAFGWSKGTGPDGWSNSENWGWSLVAHHQGVEALRAVSLTDKTLALGFAIAATGSVAALVWNTLLPDRRDALVLGALPVRAATVVVSRLVALAAYVAIVAVGMNLLASFSFGVLLAAGNTFAFALKGIAAHFIASVSASLFVFAAIVAVQGILLAAGGARFFARVSPVLQTILVGLVTIGFLTLPVVRLAAGETVRGTTGAEPWVLWTPALWFLGLYEWTLGTDNAVLVGLARTGAIALGAAAAIALTVFPLAYRRLVVASIEHGEHTRVSRRVRVARVMAMAVSRDSTVRAVSEFFLTTLVRVERHRFVMAAAVGLTLAWTIAGGGAALFAQPVAPRVDLLSLPFAAMVFLVAGMRIAAALPSTLAPSWMFDQVVPTARQNRAALERTITIVVVLPIAAGSAALAGWWWGGYAAIVHAAVLLAAAYVIVQRFVGRFGSVPCTRPWAPEHVNLRKWWPAYLLAFSAVTTGIAAIDWVFLTGIVAPSSAPLRPDLSLAVPLAVAAITGIGWSIRQQALQSVADDDAGGLEVLTEAIRTGAHRSTRLETSSGSGDEQGRDVRATAGVLFGVSRQDERDRWLDGFNLRPDELWRDLRLALRRSSQAPGFAVFSVITLALGIGVTTAVASLVIAVVARPMDIRDPESVVAIRSNNQALARAMSWLDFQDLRQQQTMFSFVEAHSNFPASLSANGLTSLVNGQLVTGGFFEMLGVQAARGRTIQPADDRPESARVVVLSESLWRTRFARDPEIIGQHVRVGGQTYEVVGVVPRSFRGIGTRAQQPGVWIAMSHPTLTDPALTAHSDPSARDRGYLDVVARLRTPDSRRAALGEVAAIGDRLDRDAPRGPSRMWTTAPIGDNQWLRAGEVYGVIVVLLPVLVLLIACTNLANLVLSRSAIRRRELAVRRALGASRWSLVRGEIVEHGLLAVVGAAGGLLLAHGLIAFVLAFVESALAYAPQNQIDARIDPIALAVATAATVLAVIVAGLVPAIRLTSDGPGRVLGNDGAGTMSPQWFGHRRLLAGQVAASLALLLVAALCLRQAFTIAQEERMTGDLSGIGVVAVALLLRTHDAVEIDEIASRILLEAGRTGELSAVAVTTGFHAVGSERVDTTTVDRPLPTGASDRSAALVAASPGIFRVLGLRFLSGQPYGDTHTRSGQRVAVISESHARALFGTTEAADREFLFRRNGESATYAARVTGVVADAGRDPRTGAPLQDVYVPFAQRFDPDARFAAWPIPIVGRPASGNASAAARLATAVRRADPDLAVHSAGSASVMSGGTSPFFGLVVQSTTALALLALALSMSGLYGVMSYLVAGRRRELGIRMALGAQHRDIVRLVVSEGIRPVAHGVGIGLVVAAIVRLAMQPLFRASSAAVDPAAVVIAVVPLAVAAAIACYLPARRAARVDPSVTLRES